MQAAVMEQFRQPLKIHKDWKDPECGANDAVLKIHANGICRSDWHMWQGGWNWLGFVPPLPTVLGHEYSGVVEEVGANVTRFKKGDRVVSPFAHACGVCPSCAAGFQNVCEDLAFPMFHYSGGFAEYAKVSRADVNLVNLPESISFIDAAGLGCRFMTAFRGVVAQAKVEAGEWVAVFGCGGVGLAAVNIASALGANVIAVSRTDEKLRMARELGAVHTFTAAEGASGSIVEYTGGGVHVAVDALGTASTWLPSIMSLRGHGRLLRLGISGHNEKGQLPLPADLLVARELTVVGSFGMQSHRYPEMLRMVESGKLTPGKLVKKRVPLEKSGDELAAMTDFSTVGMSVISIP